MLKEDLIGQESCGSQNIYPGALQEKVEKRTRAHSGKVARVIQVCSGMEEGVLRCILGRRNSLVTI